MQVLTRALRFDQNLPRKATRNCTGIPVLTQTIRRSAPHSYRPVGGDPPLHYVLTHQNMTPLDVTRYATHATASYAIKPSNRRM